MAKPGALTGQWLEHLGPELQKPYMAELRDFLQDQKKQGRVIYPPGSQIFTSFNLTPLESVRVVIIGQDPYHGPNQAHGLSFSVTPGQRIPPSLVNIFKELETDVGAPPPDHGHLVGWAQQGVFLLNAVLTVEARKAGSHQRKGWETFTDKAIEILNREREHLVFLLWGSYAQKKGALVDRTRHLILTAPHPS
ncbi:MAG: uracil-DNA glycosylase, partial [Pseudomonadota bacterium]